MPAYVIYINGYPGVGKLTVACALQKLIPGFVVLHNHELIDPVEKSYPRGSVYYQTERSEYRRERLQPIMTEPKLRNTVFIFTDSQIDYSDYTELALGERAQALLPGRGNGLNGKLTDVEVLREYRGRAGIWKFGDDDEIEIDVTSISAVTAADKTRAFIEGREKQSRSWDAEDFC